MPTATGHTDAITASKVIGTAVKNPKGEKIGSIKDILLAKTDNRIMFAIVGFDGIFGVGEKYHPLPWSVLDYQEAAKAYVVPFSKEQLEAAPHDSVNELTRDDGMAARSRAYDYYDVEADWR